MFAIHIINLKTDDEIIAKNIARTEMANHQVQQIQKTMNSIENVVEWRTDDPRFVSDDLRQQFLMKTKTRRTPTNSERAASPREKVPLATTDFGVSTQLNLSLEYKCLLHLTFLTFVLYNYFMSTQEPSDYDDDDGDQDNIVPIYTYNPSIGGTQV